MNSQQGHRLSPQQARLWLHQGENLALARCTVAIDGRLQPSRVRQALSAIVARHEAFRTRFEKIPGMKLPLQTICESRDFLWQETSIPEGDAAQEPPVFDPERGPLFGAMLNRVADDRFLLELQIPTLCADSRTLHNLFEELCDFFGNAQFDEEIVQYPDFSEWEHELLEDAEAAQATMAWERMAAPGPEWRVRLSLDARDNSSRDRVQASRTGLRLPDRPEPALLACWVLILGRLLERSDVGVHHVHRDRIGEEFDRGMGLFSAPLPLRFECRPGMTLGALADQVYETLQDALVNQVYCPWDSAMPEPGLGFALTSLPKPRQAGGLRFELVEAHAAYQPFSLFLVCHTGTETCHARLYHDNAQFPEAFARDLLESFLDLVAAFDPMRECGGFSAITAGQRARLLTAINGSASARGEAPPCLSLLAKHGSQHPDRVAAIQGTHALTRSGLYGRAGRIAAELLRRGVRPGKVVAIHMDGSPDLTAAILGVMKAGAAYLPLDPAYPEQRLGFMLRDSGARIVLADSELTGDIFAEVEVVGLDRELGKSGSFPEISDTYPDSAAYILYTSGSTGRPKGVTVGHGSLARYLRWCLNEYGLDSGWGAAVLSSIGFDLTVTSLLAPLCAGKAVVFPPADAGLEDRMRVLLEHPGASFLKLTPSHLRILNQWLPPETLANRSRPALTRVLILGGEALYEDDLAPWRGLASPPRIVNEYGPTEATVGCAVHRADAAGSGAVAIGTGIAETRLCLVDERLCLVPPWFPGEIAIGGPCLARGYHNRPDLTANAFVPDPFGHEPGARLYRSGDRARQTGTGGTLQYLGRRDSQVKIRGNRIELGEIQARLEAHPDIRQAVVTVLDRKAEAPGLIAYLVAEPAPKVDELRDFLADALPDYMIPAAFMPLDRIPLNAHGKVDLERLPVPDRSRPDLAKEYAAPRNEVETALAEVFSEILGIDRIGIHDGFFTLGGDSIRSVQAMASALERGLSFTVQDLFLNQTIADLAPGVQVLGESGTDDEADLAALLAEVEGLSDQEANERLKRMEPSRSVP